MLEHFFQNIFQKEPLTNLGRTLQKLEETDLLLIKEENEIQEESEILSGKHFLFKPRRVDIDKVDAKKVHDLHAHLSTLLIEEAAIKTSLRKVKEEVAKKKKVFTSAQKNIFSYLQRNISLLFLAIREAWYINKEIQEYLNEFPPQELAQDFNSLDRELKKIRDIVRKLLQAVKYLEQSGSSYLPAKEIVKTKDYKDDVLSYPNKMAEIFETETKIETAPMFMKKLHEPLKHTRWKGMLHARVDLNLRIIYSWDPADKRITYERLVKHSEIEL